MCICMCTHKVHIHKGIMRKKTKKVIWRHIVEDFLSVWGVSSQFIGQLLKVFEQISDIRTIWKVNLEAEWTTNWNGEKLEAWISDKKLRVDDCKGKNGFQK